MTTHCTARPDPEVIGAFVEGRLGSEERAEMIRHLDQCQSCRNEVAVLAEVAAPAESTGSRQSRWWLVAAAALVTVAGALLIPRDRTRQPVAPLVAAASSLEYRLVEARLSGFGWAEFRSPARSSTEARNPKRLKLQGAAGDALQDAAADPSVEKQHAAAIASLLIEQPADAIERLKNVTAQRPNDARAWNDLAVAYHTAAMRFRRSRDESLALTAADRALQIDPKLPEALFNRAIILESLGLLFEARDTWTRYLELDPSSEWATEARARRDKLPSTTEQSLFQKGLPQFERNAAAGASDAVAQFVARFPEQSRRHMETETLGLWAEAFRRGKSDDAERQLAIARAGGGALRSRSGEALLAEMVAVIDASPPPARTRLAQAHAMYRSGRIALGRRESRKAREHLLHAASRFGDTPGGLNARYFAAVASNLAGDAEVAVRELREVMAVAETRPDYKALRAQIAQEYGLAEALRTHWSEATEHYRRAHALYSELGERSSAANVAALLAERSWFLGRRDEAWRMWSGALRTLSETGIGNRLSVWLNAVSRNELISGSPEAARSILDVELHQGPNRGWVRAEILFRRAILSARLNDVAAGAEAIAEGQRVATAIEDPNVREQALADLGVAEGVVFASNDPRRALDSLTRAVEKRQSIRRMLLPAALFERARLLRSLERTSEAERDLRLAIEAIEEERGTIEWRDTASGALEGVDEIYLTLAELLLERGNTREAFLVADRAAAHAFYGPSATRQLDSIEELQRRIAPGAVVVEYVVRPRQTIAFAITAHAFEARTVPIGAAELEKRVTALDGAIRNRAEASIIRTNAIALHDIVIAPLRDLVGSATSVTFIPDPLLASVPFAALFDAQSERWLIEDRSVRVAASALYRLPTPQRDSSRVVIVHPSAGGVDLPRTTLEVDAIRRLYPQAILVEGQAMTAGSVLSTMRDADLIHYAGHADSERDAGLVLRDGEFLYGADIAATPLPRGPMVVLAGCRTLRGGLRREDLLTSLARAFLLAGARSVVGTSWDVEDDPAAAFFTRFHELHAHSGNAVEALCDAQRSMLRAQQHPADWAFAQIVVRTADL